MPVRHYGFYYQVHIAFLNLIIGGIGVCGNLLIVVSTLLSKDLRHKCNILTAILATFDMLTEGTFIQSAYFILNNTPAGVDNLTCFYHKVFSWWLKSTERFLCVW